MTCHIRNRCEAARSHFSAGNDRGSGLAGPTFGCARARRRTRGSARCDRRVGRVGGDRTRPRQARGETGAARSRRSCPEGAELVHRVMSFECDLGRRLRHRRDLKMKPVDGVENHGLVQRGFPSRLWARLRVHSGGTVHRPHDDSGKTRDKQKGRNFCGLCERMSQI